jgi:hypothetical protein
MSAGMFGLVRDDDCCASAPYAAAAVDDEGAAGDSRFGKILSPLLQYVTVQTTKPDDCLVDQPSHLSDCTLNAIAISLNCRAVMLDSGCFFGVCRNFGVQSSVADPNSNEAIGL